MDDLDRQEFELRRARAEINMALARIKLTRAARKATHSFQRFGMTFAAFEIAASDIGEFDNRAHDWLRTEAPLTPPAASDF